MKFDENTLHKLQQLTLVSARVRSGAIKGERRSSRRGNSVEFTDYRDYTPGDDLRRLDWNIYARLERPFIKLLEDEEDLAVTILIDGSRSMDWGHNTEHKFTYAQHMAAGLGAIALSSGDLLSVGFLQDGHVTGQFGPAHGQAALSRLFHFIESLQPGGKTGLNNALKQYAITPRRPGVMILLTDLLDPDGCQSGLRQLMGNGNNAVLLHILAPDELDPPLAGDLQLVDIETGHEQDISLDNNLRRLYRERARAWIESTRTDCHKYGIHYLEQPTSQPWEQAILLEMRHAGVVK